MSTVHLILEDIQDNRFRSACEQLSFRKQKYNVPDVEAGILCNRVYQTAGLGITHIEHPQPVTSGKGFFPTAAQASSLPGS